MAPTYVFPALPLSPRRARQPTFSTSHQETTSGTIELPDDDPKILRYFLQFLYTGNYDDGATPCVGTPSLAALASPGEVIEKLQTAPGVAVPLGEYNEVGDEQAPRSMSSTPGSDEVMANGSSAGAS